MSTNKSDPKRIIMMMMMMMNNGRINNNENFMNEWGEQNCRLLSICLNNGAREIERERELKMYEAKNKYYLGKMAWRWLLIQLVGESIDHYRTALDHLNLVKKKIWTKRKNVCKHFNYSNALTHKSRDRQ